MVLKGGFFPPWSVRKLGPKQGRKPEYIPGRRQSTLRGSGGRGTKEEVPGREGSQGLLALDLLAGGRDLAEAQAGRPNLLLAIVFGAGKHTVG